MQTDIMSKKFRISRLSQPCDKSLKIQQSVSETTQSLIICDNLKESQTTKVIIESNFNIFFFEKKLRCSEYFSKKLPQITLKPFFVFSFCRQTHLGSVFYQKCFAAPLQMQTPKNRLDFLLYGKNISKILIYFNELNVYSEIFS